MVIGTSIANHAAKLKVIIYLLAHRPFARLGQNFWPQNTNAKTNLLVAPNQLLYAWNTLVYMKNYQVACKKDTNVV